MKLKFVGSRNNPNQPLVDSEHGHKLWNIGDVNEVPAEEAKEILALYPACFVEVKEEAAKQAIPKNDKMFKEVHNK